MLVTLTEALDDARRDGAALACINTPSFDLARAVVRAAEQVGAPVVIDHAEVHDPTMPVETIGPFMVRLAERARVPVAVHVDHGLTEAFILRCLRQGFTSAMYDLSTRPPEENTQRIARFTSLMHAAGVSVEAELGVMGSADVDTHGGSPARPAGPRSGFTDPGEAAEYARATGVDALAVCFGTVHGMYSGEPHVDLESLADIRAAVPEETALVMHGSSGLPLETLTRAVRAGVSKVNYYTYLAIDASRFAATYVGEAGRPVYYHELSEAVVDHATEHARAVIQALRP